MRALLLVLLLAACSRAEAPPVEKGEGAAAGDSETAVIAVTDTGLPEMPEYPGQRRGHLVAHGVGALDINAAWAAWAGRCERPPMIVVIAEEPSNGASVLLRLPPGDSLAGDYPISDGDSAAPPPARTSQVGFQFFQASMADTYQSVDGTVELSRVSPARVSGRLAVTLRHVGDEHLARVAGVFDEVAVRALSPDWCARAAAAHDSLAALHRDSLAGDSAAERKTP
jgi:hypothetical protein